MRWRWMAAGAIAVVALGACGDSGGGNGDSGTRGGEDQSSAGGGYDEAAYCALVEEALDREPPTPAGLDGELTAQAAKDLEAAFSEELAFTEKVAAAAPEDLADEWASVVDVQAGVAEQGRKFLDPEFLADFRAKSEAERAEFLFTELLGPFEDLDEKDLDAVADHAASACGVEGLFGVE